jgi:hypothetical protein
MTCTHCSTEIADKALICYRCGHATSEPRVKPPASGPLLERPRRKRLPMTVIVIALLILLGLALWLLVEQPWTSSRIPSPQHEAIALQSSRVMGAVGEQSESQHRSSVDRREPASASHVRPVGSSLFIDRSRSSHYNRRSCPANSLQSDSSFRQGKTWPRLPAGSPSAQTRSTQALGST